MWIYNEFDNKIVKKDLDFVPALYKIFDEILVNAADNKRRDETTSFIKINVNQMENEISITNDGCGIPVIVHSSEGIYIPTLIFGHLLTSSNYDDSVGKITGGRNGFGAKLCNIFSKKFTIETSSQISGYSFKQTWTDNMTQNSEPIIEPASSQDYTKVTFSPDLTRFSMSALDLDIISLFHRRAVDIAACLANVSVYFNDSRIPIGSFREYVELFRHGQSQCVHKIFNDSLEVAVTVSPNYEFNQMSFVNAIHTDNGGQHVDYFTNQLVKQLMDVVKDRFKDDADLIRPNQIKNALWVFVNAVVVNPTFESQSKDYLAMLPDNFQSKMTISDKFVKEVANCGVLDKIEAAINVKKMALESKTVKSKYLRLNIAKVDDAICAGTNLGHQCTLILTEGDSAKTLVLSGLSVIGKKFYGIYPLRGKALNVRDLDVATMSKNEEFSNLIKILGLNYKTKYLTKESLNSLRYGKVMIMTDQDPDGSHIKGLIINFFHYNWPELLQHDFLEMFITPIIKAFKNNIVKSFYSIPEYKNWQKSTVDIDKWRIKYYKGLGTSTSAEAKEYFSEIENHRKKFHYSGPDDDELLKMAFDKRQGENRKNWLLQYMKSHTDHQDKDINEDNIYDKDIKSISYRDFVNKELVIFSNVDNERSIPSIMDGLKPAQRKVIFTCLKRNLTKEIKVAQLAGSVAELSSYHHGEASLYDTITGLAQDFIGSNNINLLMPIGQFGTRVYGGKDSASGRYIFTKLAPITKMIFHPDDENILTYLSDNNQSIEPKWYCPIIPMILVNGCDGIGTGWKSSIPNYNPLDIIANLKRIISGQNPVPMTPWFKNFQGTITEISPNKYVSIGSIKKISASKFEITELPVRVWTQTYKENVLNSFMTDKNDIIKEFEEYNTDTDVKFIVQTSIANLKKFNITELCSLLKLKKAFSTEQMILYDENNKIERFNTAEDILLHFYKVRLLMYEKRKAHISDVLAAKASKLENQLRFIEENINGTLEMRNIKEKDLIDLMVKKNYDSDPFKNWATQLGKRQNATGSNSDMGNENVREDQFDFNYLLTMPLKMLTKDNFETISSACRDKRTELANLKQKSPQDLWLDDLQLLEDEILFNGS